MIGAEVLVNADIVQPDHESLAAMRSEVVIVNVAREHHSLFVADFANLLKFSFNVGFHIKM